MTVRPAPSTATTATIADPPIARQVIAHNVRTSGMSGVAVPLIVMTDRAAPLIIRIALTAEIARNAASVAVIVGTAASRHAATSRATIGAMTAVDPVPVATHRVRAVTMIVRRVANPIVGRASGKKISASPGRRSRNGRPLTSWLPTSCVTCAA
jgi:hypothetical protein